MERNISCLIHCALCTLVSGVVGHGWASLKATSLKAVVLNRALPKPRRVLVIFFGERLSQFELDPRDFHVGDCAL